MRVTGEAPARLTLLRWIGVFSLTLFLLAGGMLETARAATQTGTLTSGSTAYYDITLPTPQQGMRLVLSSTASSDFSLYTGIVHTAGTLVASASTGQTLHTLLLPVASLTAGASYHVRIHANAALSYSYTPDLQYARTLTWDPGTSLAGSSPTLQPDSAGGDYLFQVTGQAPAHPAWRSVLQVTGGTADLFLQQGSVPTSSGQYNSISAGSGSLYAPADQSLAGQVWYLRVHAAPNATWTLLSGDLYVQDLSWDPGTAAAGSSALSQPATAAGDYFFRVTSQSPATGAWRTVLNLSAGEADLFQQQGTVPLGDSYYKSTNVGSDGIVLSANQFSTNQTWYIRVHASAASSWNILSGEIYARDLGTLVDSGATLDFAGNPASSGNVSTAQNVKIGPEGTAYFKVAVDASTLGWRLWLSGAANTMYVRQAAAPVKTVWTELADQFESGQMLLVPPYLTNAVYFVGVTGAPGTVFSFDSRKQQVTTLNFSSNTPAAVTGYGYTTYRVDVPIQQIAWQVNLAPGSGSQNPDLYLRQGNIPNRWTNDGLSEAPAGVTDSITQVPPTLADGTWYVTVYGTGSFSYTLKSGVPTVTGESFINDPNLYLPLGSLTYKPDTHYPALCPSANPSWPCKVNPIANDDPNRSGWRYYQVSDISSQLGYLGWQLDLASQVAGSEIALRKNAVPARWNFRTGGSAYQPYVSSSSQLDLSSTLGFLQHPGHPADIWYVGVYTPNQALGPFQLTTREIPTAPLAFLDGSATCQSTPASCASQLSVAGQPPQTWKWFKVAVPSDPNLRGWDLRLKVAGGVPQMQVRRDQLPPEGGGIWYNWSSWPSGGNMGAGADYTGNTTGELSLIMGMGNPLEPGTYYIGVTGNGSDPTALSYSIVSRSIGFGSDLSGAPWPLQVQNLAFSPTQTTGSETRNVLSGSALAPRQADYYRVTVPAGVKSWSLHMEPQAPGDAFLVLDRDRIPNAAAYNGCGGYNTCSEDNYGTKRSKSGREFFYKYAPEGGTVSADYYIGVVSQGSGGGNPVAYTLTSEGEMPVNRALNPDSSPKSVQSGSPVSWNAETLLYGQEKVYRFRVPAGLTGIEIRLKNKIGNPIMWYRSDPAEGGQIPYGWGDYAESEGGAAQLASHNSLITVANPAPGDYTVVVGTQTQYITNVGTAYPDASFDLEVTATGVGQLGFTNGTAQVVGQEALSWKWYAVTVPVDANLRGWDLRLKVAGGVPQMQVRRDLLPPGGGGIWYNYNSWASGNSMGAGADYTGNTTGELSLIMGLGNPLEPGTYYVGVTGNGSDPTPLSYSIVSRGIGFGSDAFAVPWPLQVQDLAFSPTQKTGAETRNTLSGAGVALRQADYYRVTVPAGSKSWSLQLEPQAPGELLMVLAKDRIPNPGAYNGCGGYNTCSEDNYGTKRSKTGREFFYKYAPENAPLPAGDYYIGVVGQGAGPVAYTLTSAEVPVNRALNPDATPKAVQPGNPIAWNGESLKYGQEKVYRFRVPAGVTGVEIRLNNKLGNPLMWYRSDPADGGQIPYGWGDYAESEGGAPQTANNNSLMTVSNPPAGDYTVVVGTQSQYVTNVGTTYPDANFDLVVTATGLGQIDFVNGSAQVAGQSSLSWQWFAVTVPVDPNLRGWDLRLQVAGGLPQMQVRRDLLPPGGGGIWYNYNNWPSGSTFGAGADYISDNPAERSLIMGMGNPLEPGTYYIGVTGNGSDTVPLSYTLVSRGIGFASNRAGVAWPLQVQNLAFSLTQKTGTETRNTLSGGALANRQAAYYRVTVPAGSKSWGVQMDPQAPGEALLVLSKDRIPNAGAYNGCGGYNTCSENNYGTKRSKTGREFFYKYAPDGGTVAGEYYLGVVSQGTGSGDPISYTVTSIGEVPVHRALNPDLTPASVQPGSPVAWNGESLMYGQEKVYRFRVPAGLTGIEMRLKNSVGKPFMWYRSDPNDGGQIPYGWGDYAESEGGATQLANNSSLITVANPAAGDYTIVVGTENLYVTNIGTTYPDASFDLEVVAKAPVLLPVDKGSLTSHLIDQQMDYYQITIPDQVGGFPVAGWKIGSSATNGQVRLFVAKGNIPNTANQPTLAVSTPFVVMAPPYLAPGVWYVAVEGVGITDYTVTSQLISAAPAYHSRSWTMPAASGSFTACPDLSQTNLLPAPLFGDAGVLPPDTGGVCAKVDNPSTHDQGIDLAQDDWHFYRVTVPDNNGSILKTVVEALSGKPELYLRQGSVPSVYHGNNESQPNSYPPAYDRSQTTSGTMYGNWVPLDRRTEVQLAPGDWWLGVRAVNSNVRYRLKVAAGNVRNGSGPLDGAGYFQDLDLSAGSKTGQTLAAGDMRYYRVLLPQSSATLASSTPSSWTINLQKQVGNVTVLVRDTIPPGQGSQAVGGASAAGSGDGNFQDWYDDSSGLSPNPFVTVNSIGDSTFTVPPLRPGKTYYLGVYALSDASFDLSSRTSGPNLAIAGIIPFVNGNVTANLSAGEAKLYRIDAPLNAAYWQQYALHDAGINLYLAQDTVPPQDYSAHWRSSGSNSSFSRVMGAYPWQPGHSYYLLAVNTTAGQLPFTFVMNGIATGGGASGLVPGNIITVAGGGVGGNSPATSALLRSPQGVALDGAGNAYVADTGNHLVRKISATTGLITTIAGTGLDLYGGDGGPAAAANLNGPQGVALDGAGNLYIADTGNQRIRKVNLATGVITTVAGNGSAGFSGDHGFASTASLSYPAGVALDGAGNLYIADTNNYRIRKVNSAGIITTVAGTGNPGYSGDGQAALAAGTYANAVAADAAGNLYIADSSNNRIRKVVASTGIISTVAGSGVAGYGGDMGPASSAQLNSPSGVALDASGNLYIADRYNYRVRKVAAATGVITTIAGNGAGFSGDGGPANAAGMYPCSVAVAGSGNLYIADYNSGRIRLVSSATGIISTVAGSSSTSYSGDGGAATAATLSYNQGVAVDSAGNLFFADRNNHRVRKVTAATGAISTIAGNGDPGYSGDLGAATQASLSSPQGVAVDGAGNVFIADTNNCRIRKVDLSGMISSVVGNYCSFGGDGALAGAAYLSYPQGITLDGSGNLYIADTYNQRIRKVDFAGIITTVAGSGSAGYSGDGALATAANLYYPASVALDGSGNLYIADYYNHRVRKVNSTSHIISTFAGNGSAGFSGDGAAASGAGLSYPSGVTLDAAGNLYIADSGNNRVRRVDAATLAISSFAGNWNQGFSGDGGPATLASLYTPLSVALDGSGNLFISDSNNSRIREVIASVTPVTTIAPPGGSYGTPQSVTLTGNKPVTTYYTTNGSIPTTGSSVYSGPLALSTSTTVKFFSVDGAGNSEGVKSASYTITMTAPTTSASPAGGVFSAAQNVTLSCNDGAGVCGSTYYCLGSACTPTTLYSAPIAITGSTLLRFYSKDSANHSEAVVQAGYTIFAGYNTGVVLPGAPGTIITYAGGGTGSGSAGNSTSLQNPQAVALDGAGNSYIADTDNNLVRKVSAATGTVSIVAGTGSAGFSGDGGPASAASLNSPQGVALDGAGNLYIADVNNHRIRKVDGAGVITTIAGNGDNSYPGDGSPAVAASISPIAVAADSSGNVYLVDRNLVRKVDTAGIITTVAGNGGYSYDGDGVLATAAAIYPNGVALDGLGNLYISDYNNQRIRKVSAATGLISTVAGNGTGGYGGDGGPAVAAELSSPSGIALDGSGNLYFADRYNYRIRKVAASTGIISTIAGSGPGFTGDGGPASAAGMYPYAVAVDLSGNLFIADYSNDRVRKVSAATGIISTIAGNGSTSYSGDGGAASTATLAYPQGVAMDASGNLYLADKNNHRVRKVSAATGAITTVAGNGTAGNSGDLGAAIQSSLNSPQGVALDGAGNLFIADSNNCRIRKVDSLGMISTVAGNYCGFGGDGAQASAAHLYYPQGVALDGAGNLYIADSLNNRIRKVDGSGVITTLAGDGSAGFGGDGALATAGKLNNPTAVALDASGNLYIADFNNHRIREISAATGFISTVAGSGGAGFFGDGGQAIAANLKNPGGVTVDGSGNLYISDNGNSRVRRVDAVTGVILTVAGTWTQGFSGDGGPATLASLNSPQGVALDAGGNIFFADTNNNRIREVVESLAPITSATPPGGSFGSPQSVTLTGSKPVTTYYTTNGSAPTTLSSVYSGPLALSVTTTLRFFSVDAAGHTGAAKSASYTITLAAPATTASPAGGIFPVPQNVTLSCNDGAGVCGSTYYCLGFGCTPTTLYSAPIPVTGSALLRYYSKDSLGHSEAVSQAGYTIFPGYSGGGALPGGIGTIITYAGGWVGNNSPGTQASLNYPQAVALDASGNTYIADSNNHLVRKISAATGIISTVAGTGRAGFSGDGGQAVSASLNSPQGVALDGAGNLYISDVTNHRIRKVDSLGVISTVAGNGDSLYPGDGSPAVAASISPTGIAADAPGNIYLVDGNHVRKVDTAGVITTVAGNGGYSYTGDGTQATGSGMYPNAIALDGSGNIYLADSYNQRVLKVTAATGIITTVAGNGSGGFGGDGAAASAAQLNSPAGIALDASGNLFIADRYNYRIRKVAAAGGVISTVAGSGSGGFSGDGAAAGAAGVYPVAVAVDAGGNLYIVDYNNSRIRKVTAATGFISTVAGNGSTVYSGDSGFASAATMYNPQGVALDAAGNLYVADKNNQRIRKVSAATGAITTVAGNGSAGSAGDLGQATQANLNSPQGVALDGAGNLYIADTYNCRIRKVDNSGQISTVAGSYCSFGGDGALATAAYLSYPQGVALDAGGNLYIADSSNNRIRKVAGSGIITTVAGNGLAGLAGDGAQAAAGKLNNPTSVALDSSGNLYIADNGNQRIRKVSAAGTLSTLAGSGNAGFFGDGGAAASANLFNPTGVSLDGSGNLFIADSGNNRVRRVDAVSGVITTMAGSVSQGFSGDGGAANLAELNAPQGVAVDGNGNLFIADTGNNRVREVGESFLFSVTLNPGPHGSIVGPTQANYGSMPSYSFQPATGYHVSAASVNGQALGAVSSYHYSSWITSSQTLAASFAINSYTLNFAAGPNGSITGAASQTVVHGGSATAVNAQPNAGYHLVNWTDASSNVLGTNSTLTLVNVTGSLNVTANFAINSFTITTSAAAGGAISASQTVNQGGNSAPVTVTPNLGYHIATVLVDSVSQAVNNQKSYSVTFSAVAANHSVSASFATDTGPKVAVTLTGVNGGSGTVNSIPAGIACGSGTCSAYYASGTAVTLVATPDSNSLFSGWSGACSATSGNCVLNVNADQTVGASFSYVAPARNNATPRVYFNQLQVAYDAAVTGSTIQARDFIFTENLILGRNVNVYLDGGEDINYVAAPGVTTLHGSLFIRGGSLRVDKLQIH